MTNLVNHPGKWLSPAAAASLARFEKDHGVIPVSSAGRYESEQQELINRWDKGGSANRPPRLYQPARPAATSNHVKGGGLAIDTSGNGIALMHKFGEAYGWFFNYAYDVVHFEYNGSRDQHRNTTPASRPAGFNQGLANQQDFMNRSVRAGLIVDGLTGPKTIAGIKKYQTFLRKYGYKGAIDGKWGSGTQAAHAKYFAIWSKK